ncbi:MAG: OmpA family protein [Alloprevotella sp.]|nr:OmpA family protein [Alloprevotella sp.]
MKQFLLLLLISFFLVGCSSVDKLVKRGDNALAIGEYAEAAAWYRKAYIRTPTKDRDQRGVLSFKLAEAYRRYGNVARALGSYRTAERYHYTDTTTCLHEGDMMRMMGDYKGAREAYNRHLEKFPNDEAAIFGLRSCADAEDGADFSAIYTVKPASLFNSSRSDYYPQYAGTDGDMLYFTTTRRQVQGSDLSGITAMKPGDIYFSKKDEKGRWKTPEPVEGLNSEYDEGTASFNTAGNTMYLTICRTDGQYPRMAEIYKSQRSDAKWGKPALQKITADTLSSYAHPALAPDGRTLYFVSDMPGGLGGFDIWRVISDDKGTGIVENLGPEINTPGNELFPTFRENGDLYFSSDGRYPNFGGLDLYVAKPQAASAGWHVSHLPKPMNSPADDFGITFEHGHNHGYFSSSRSTGGRGWDKIFEFSYPEQLQTVKGWVYEQDGYELPAAQVYMVGTDGTNEKIPVQTDGSFERPVREGVQYMFLAVCDGYLNYHQTLKPDTVAAPVQHVLQFPLPSINIPVLVRGIHYQFDKAELTDSSRVALDRLVKLLRQNPNVTIELSSHCDYRGTEAYNDDLSQRRAQSVVDYLIKGGVEKERLTAKGYGKSRPKVVTRKIAETYPFLHVGDTLTTARIDTLAEEQREIANALNRRTEFRVLRTTYGLFDEKGNLRPEALKKREDESSAATREEDMEVEVYD